MATLSYSNRTTEVEETAQDQDAPDCIFCDQQLASSRGFCKYCESPGEISALVRQRQVQPKLVSVLGAEGAGKTVYLGLLLDILNSSSGSVQGSANGTFSIALQETVITALERQVFPESTKVDWDAWQWAHLEVRTAKGKKTVSHDIVAPDISGTALNHELDNPGSYPSIETFVQQSNRILMLCDATAVRDAGAKEDLFALKMASYVDQRWESDRKKKKRNASLAIVLTKTDQCPEAHLDPRRFATNEMPRFADFCQRHFPSHEFFGVSAIGATATVGDGADARDIPLHVQPRGITQPLKWLLG